MKPVAAPAVKIIDARFVITAVEQKGYPPAEFPEVAFVGRSNVGKSSMINVLAARRKLVRVSNTPGRTRALNFFDLDVELRGHRKTVRLVDLPGYGFARVSKADKAQWKELISEYIETREILQVVVSIIDAEVGASAEDVQTLDYLSEHNARILVAATKIDRLPKAKRKPRLKQLAQTLQLSDAMVVPFSATDKIGVDEVWEALFSILDFEGPKKDE